MDPIDAAIEDLELQRSKAEVLYTEIAAKHHVDIMETAADVS
jgi:hypothetical protein